MIPVYGSRINAPERTQAQARPYVREASIFDYARVVVRHWKLVLLVCVPTVVVVAVLSLVWPKSYRATASIVPPLESGQGGDLGLMGGFLGGAESALLRRTLGVTSVADVYIGILESRAVADAIIDRLDLMEVYEQPGDRWRTREQLRNSTEIKVVEKQGVVKVSVVDRDPNRAAAIANAYVEELDSQNKRLSGGQAKNKRIFLENRLAEIDKQLSRIDDIPSREAQVQQMLYELLIRECELAKIEEAKTMPTIQVLDQATPPEFRHSPKRRRMVTKAAVASFAVAVFLAFLSEYRQRLKRDNAAERFRRPGGTGETADGAVEEPDLCEQAAGPAAHPSARR